MTTLNISLSDEMKAFIEARITEDGFSSASEYLHSLLRDAQKRKGRKNLEAKLLEGLQGESKELNAEEWASIRSEALERMSGETLKP